MSPSDPSRELRARAEFLQQLMPRIGKSLRKQLGRMHQACSPCLTSREFAVLDCLKENATATMRELARHHGVTMPTMTGLIARLVEKKLVERVPASTDRRQVLIRLTKLGLREYEAHVRHSLEIFTRLLSSLNSPEQTRLIEAFKTIERILVKPVD